MTLKFATDFRKFHDNIMAESARKEDYVVPAQTMTYSDEGTLLLKGQKVVTPNLTAKNQIAQWLGIPVKYFSMMEETNKPLLAENVNRWLAHPSHERDQRLVRTLDGTARAVLSERYKMLDNVDVMRGVLPVMSQIPTITICEAEVTEKKLYIKAFVEDLFADVAIRGETRDIVRCGVMISNSEVGMGALAVTPLLRRDFCGNNWLAYHGKARQAHLGGRYDMDANEDLLSMLSEETRQADARATMMKIGDILKGALSKDVFEKNIAMVRKAQGQPLNTKAIPDTISKVAKQYSMVEAEQDAILEHLIKGADLTTWGLSNAITRAAHDVGADRRVELETIGTRVLTLTSNEYKMLEAA